MALRTGFFGLSRRRHAIRAALRRDLSRAAEMASFARNSDGYFIYAKSYGLAERGPCTGSEQYRETDAAHAEVSE